MSLVKCSTCGGDLVVETERIYAKKVGKRQPKLLKEIKKLQCLKCGKKI